MNERKENRKVGRNEVAAIVEEQTPMTRETVFL